MVRSPQFHGGKRQNDIRRWKCRHRAANVGHIPMEGFAGALHLTAAVPAPGRRDCDEVPHGLRHTALSRVDDANGMLLPSLVLPSAMRAGLQHLLLFPLACVPLRRSLIFARPFFLGRAGPEIERLQTPLIVSFSGPVSSEPNFQNALRMGVP